MRLDILSGLVSGPGLAHRREVQCDISQQQLPAWLEDRRISRAAQSSCSLPAMKFTAVFALLLVAEAVQLNGDHGATFLAQSAASTVGQKAVDATKASTEEGVPPVSTTMKCILAEFQSNSNR